MRRIQLHLDEELDDALAARARTEGIPKAALIRKYLRGHVAVAHGQADDPSLRLIGIYNGDAADSVSVDEVVYGK
jgi:hypothetical protein